MTAIVILALGLLIVGRPTPRPRIAGGPGHAASGASPGEGPGWFGAELARCMPGVEAGPVWRRGRWTLAAPVGLAVLAGWLPALASVLGAGVVVGGGWWFTRGRAAARLEAALPALVDDLSRASRSGVSVSSALRSARVTGPLGTDLALVAAALDRGLGLRRALDQWRERHPLPSVVLVCTALVLAEGSGGSRSRALAAVSDTLRERRELAAEVRALASQGRASAAVLVVAPVLFALAGSALDDRLGRFLFETRAGWACLAGGLLLDLAGGLWMARLVENSHAL